VAALGAALSLAANPGAHAGALSAAGPHVSFEQVHAIIHQRCEVCHSIHPQITTFGPTPGGIQFDTPERIHSLAERIKVRAVITRTMPLGNLSHITDDE